MTDRIFTRLTLPVSIVSVLTLLLGLSAAWYVSNLQEDSAILVDNHLESMRAAYELELAVRDMRRQFFRYLRYERKDDLKPLPELRERVEKWLNRIDELSQMREEIELAARLRTGSNQLFAEVKRYEDSLPPEGAVDGLTQAIEERLAANVYTPVDLYQKFNEALLTNSIQSNHRLAGRLITGLVGVGVCGAVGGICTGVVIGSSLRRRIARTEEQLRRTAERLGEVAGGPIEPPPHPRSFDELDAAVRNVSASAAAVIERFDRTRRDALRAEQLAYVGQMAAGIAHEVRNPLMAIKILVQKAGERNGSGPIPRRDLQVLEDEILRVERIVSGFLDFARPPQLERRAVEAGPLVRSVVDRLAFRAEEQEVTLRCTLPADPLWIDADGGQVEQVVYNLVLNALDAQPAGGEVAAELSVDAAAREAVIRVADRGTGLPATIAERIFEPFISTKESGLGLGLSICKRIVEAHQGTIRGENGPRGGAIFTVRLPLAAANQFQGSRSEIQVQNPELAAPNLEPGT